MTRVLGALLTLCCAAPLLHAEDVDADGMDDVWEVQYWGNTDATPSADPDGDGVSNLVEFQACLNPLPADIPAKKAGEAASPNLLRRLRDKREEVRQKVSGCFRSDAGAKRFCVISSYISTIRQQGLNLIDSIKAAFAGKPVSLTT